MPTGQVAQASGIDVAAQLIKQVAIP
jgi:hypothetical protein